MQIELTDAEVVALTQMFDIVLKSGGLQVLDAVVHFRNKLKALPDQVDKKDDTSVHLVV